MWISREDFNRLKSDIKTLENNGKLFAQQANKVQEKYDRLLRHLKLSEWTESATPEKTVLITEKEVVKRVKAGEKGKYKYTALSSDNLFNQMAGNRQPSFGLMSELFSRGHQ
jgi:hypothetical protein